MSGRVRLRGAVGGKSRAAAQDSSLRLCSTPFERTFRLSDLHECMGTISAERRRRRATKAPGGSPAALQKVEPSIRTSLRCSQLILRALNRSSSFRTDAREQFQAAASKMRLRDTRASTSRAFVGAYQMPG